MQRSQHSDMSPLAGGSRPAPESDDCSGVPVGTNTPGPDDSQSDTGGGMRMEQNLDREASADEPAQSNFRLSFFDVVCLIANRMIGTGIFNSPQAVIIGTRSTGAALLLWLLGFIYSLAAIHVYVEYGLNVPRFLIAGTEQAVPRSGGDLHYLSYVYSWPYFREKIVLYSACVFGISFILAGNMAGNCVSFGMRVLLASDPRAPLDKAQVYTIATAAAAFSCVIHAISRRGGILLNNFLATVKLLILLLICCVTIALLARAFKDQQGRPIQNVLRENLDLSVAFRPPVDSSTGGGPPVTSLEDASLNSYASAFLSIIWAFGGLEQANHVLGEINNPRRTYPRGAVTAVVLVGSLYLIVNLCYMTVVPAHLQSTSTVALLFFQRTLARFPGDILPDRIFNSFLALSSFGNVIVTTYTAARMKQEIAKQGFIPYYKFFAKDADVSVGRLVNALRRKKWPVPFFADTSKHRETTPVGALILHLAACLVLIWSTYPLAPTDSFILLTGLSSYLIYAIFSFFLALGILLLRTRGPPPTYPARIIGHPEDHGIPYTGTWKSMTGRSILPWLSVTAATVYLLGNAFPIVAVWVRSTSRLSASNVPWFILPTLSWSIVAFASLWWIGFFVWGRRRERKGAGTLILDVSNIFEWADAPNEPERELGHDERYRYGGHVLIREEITFRWRANEIEDNQLRGRRD